MVYKANDSIISIQAEAINPIQTNVVFWSHDRGTAKLRMKLVRKNGIPQSLPEGTTVPIRLIFKSATAEGGYGKPLSNYNNSKLAGLLKIKLKNAGIRIVYNLVRIDSKMVIIIIGARADNEVYKLAEDRLKK